MANEIDRLRESNAFLNLLLDHIDAAVLIADEHLDIHQFNHSFLNLFDRAAGTPPGGSFGRISGCVNAVLENRSCGKTSQCRFCVLRRSLIEMLTAEVPVDRKRLERTFYIDGRPVPKHLDFSARPIQFQGRRMILVIIFDVTDIEARKRELEAKQLQIDQDLRAAAEIQKSLLPQHPPDHPRLRTAWRFAPCRQVGGDIFQVQGDGPDRVSAYLLDVCGHGVAAAMVAVAVSQFLTSLHSRGRLTGKPFAPAAVLNRLDAAFPLDRFDCHFTIAFAALDAATGRLTYANAGHVPPVVLRAGGAPEVLHHHGTVVGAGMTAPYTQADTALGPGDILLMATDGILDAFSPGRAAAGLELFLRYLGERDPAPVDALADAVMAQARRRGGSGDPEDDMSLLAVEYRGDG